MKFSDERFIAAEQILFNPENGAVSLINLVDGFQFKSLPAKSPKYNFILGATLTGVDDDIESLEVKLSVQTPSGEIIDVDVESSRVVPLSKDGDRKIIGASISRPIKSFTEVGDYRVIALIGDHQILSDALNVSLNTEE